MMVSHAKNRYTTEEFDQFVLLPENSERLFEFVAGRIVEKIPHFNIAVIAGTLTMYLVGFVKEHQLGFVTGGKGSYIVCDERYMPSMAFVSKGRQPFPSREIFNPIPPDLAVEYVSPTTSEQLLRIKTANYLAAGTVVWVVYPEIHEIEVYYPGQAVQTLRIDDTLDGGEVLPGFTLPVKDIFPEE